MNVIARFVLAASLAIGFLAPGERAIAAGKEKLTVEQKATERDARLKLAADGLEKLYKIQPEAREAVEKAVGYAVFDISSIYAILLVGQKGKGVLFDNATKTPIFMLSTRAGTGPGVGKQRVFQIFVFKTKDAMNQFKLAGKTGGDISGSVSTGTGGSVRSFNPSIDVYQVPEQGTAVQASWGGTLYSVDSDLQ